MSHLQIGGSDAFRIDRAETFLAFHLQKNAFGSTNCIELFRVKKASPAGSYVALRARYANGAWFESITMPADCHAARALAVALLFLAIYHWSLCQPVMKLWKP